MSASTQASVSSSAARSSFSLSSISSALDAIDSVVLAPVEGIKSMMSTQTDRESVSRSTPSNKSTRSSIYSVCDRPSIRDSTESSRASIDSTRGSVESARGSLARSSVSFSEPYRRTPHHNVVNSYNYSIQLKAPVARPEAEMDRASRIIKTIVSFVSITILVLIVCAAFIFSNELLAVARSAYNTIA